MAINTKATRNLSSGTLGNGAFRTGNGLKPRDGRSTRIITTKQLRHVRATRQPSYVRLQTYTTYVRAHIKTRAFWKSIDRGYGRGAGTFYNVETSSLLHEIDCYIIAVKNVPRNCEQPSKIICVHNQIAWRFVRCELFVCFRRSKCWPLWFQHWVGSITVSILSFVVSQ